MQILSLFHRDRKTIFERPIKNMFKNIKLRNIAYKNLNFKYFI